MQLVLVSSGHRDTAFTATLRSPTETLGNETFPQQVVVDLIYGAGLAKEDTVVCVASRRNLLRRGEGGLEPPAASGLENAGGVGSWEAGRR